MGKLASFFCLVLMLAVPVVVSGCQTDTAQSNSPSIARGPASASSPASGETAVAAQTTEPVVAAQPASASALADADTAATDYRISPRDILQVSVFQVQDLNNTVEVSEDGTITLPLVGKMRVSGKTTREAEELIADKLGKKYLQSPQVSVSVKTYGKRITVSGAVKAPRVLSDDGNLTLTQAIASAGGTSDLADPSRIHIARLKNQHVQDAIYNLNTIQAGQATDPLLKGGDIVVVEESGTRVALKSVKDLLPFALFATLF